MRFGAITAAAVLSAALSGAVLCGASAARAGGDPAGQFDYYVLSLSWSPNWCATEGQGRDAAQCQPGSGASFVLHGLWPQDEQGYPSDCRTTQRDPSKSQSAAMQDVMGSDGLAWHEWKKHGRCSGLSATDYYATARKAYASVTIPDALKHLTKDVTLPASVVEQAFLEANPALTRDEITVLCQDNRISEVRVCLTKDLQPRRCGDDVIRDCRSGNALMDAVR